MTQNRPRRLLFVTVRTARRRMGKWLPSREEMPVKNVRISIARLSASLGRRMMT